MEIKLFGKSLFSARSEKADMFMNISSDKVKESKYLPDFHNMGHGGFWDKPMNSLSDFVVNVEGTTTATAKIAGKNKKTDEVKIEKKHLTPKGVHELKLLNDETFKVNFDPAYVDGQLELFKDKLSLIKSEEFDMRRGVEEVGSIVVRMENRKKYEGKGIQAFFEQFPYTTNSRIEALVKEHDYLKLGQVAQFIADMPKEAVNVMKEYNKFTGEVCGKQAVFYIIADKKDFQKTNTRRDPILLAQSPFGHFWQILGAWDKEMLFIDEL